jgi:DNA polymerase-3 subunit epsilon
MKHLEQNGVVTLNRLTEIDAPDRSPQAGDVAAVILDVETTGLNPESDDVIQIALRPFFVNPETGEISGLKSAIHFLGEPSRALPQIITDITGFTDEDLKGHAIPWKKIAGVLSRCKFIVAHNASFDRKFVDAALRRFGVQVTGDAIWCCSMTQIDWTPVCRPSRALEVLSAWHGFYYDSHNAVADVDATLHLLRQADYMQALLSAAGRSDYRVFAAGSLRDENHLLKGRRYRWNPDVMCWWKMLATEEEAVEETTWLTQNLTQVDPQYYEVEPQLRFA